MVRQGKEAVEVAMEEIASYFERVLNEGGSLEVQQREGRGCW